MGIAERKAREKERRRNSIIDAAERIFFSKGVDAATMDEIAEEAELSKGTLYLYFSSKEDLYLAMTKRGLDILTEMFRKAVAKAEKGIDQVQAIGSAYYAFSQEYADYFQGLVYFRAFITGKEKSLPSAAECELQGQEALGVVAEALAAGIRDGSIRKDIDPVVTAVILWGQSNGIIQIVQTKWEHINEQHFMKSLVSGEDLLMHAFQLIRRSLKP